MGIMTGGVTSTSTFMRHAETLAFNDETVAVRTTALATATDTPGATGSSTHSYVAGGDNGSIYTTLITKIDYATRTGTGLAAALATGRASGGGVYNATNGYYLGGNNGSNLTEIDGIVFSTDTATNPNAALGTANFYPSPVMSDTKGYAADFYGIFGFTFSSETVATLSATMPTARNAATGINSTTTGYFCGGSATTTEIDGLTFASEAAVNPSAALPTGIKYASGMSYKIAGSSPTTDTSTAIVGGMHTATATATAVHDASQGTPLSDSHTAAATAGHANDGLPTWAVGILSHSPDVYVEADSSFTKSCDAAEGESASAAVSAVSILPVSREEIAVANSTNDAYLVLRVVAAAQATASDIRDAVITVRVQGSSAAGATASQGALQTFLVVGDEEALAVALAGNTLATNALVHEAVSAITEQLTIAVDPVHAEKFYIYFPHLYGHRLYCITRK